jgi:glycine/D-amino acid oxidase-like deaminating enzyme
MPDPLQIIPRDMPFTIYADAQQLQWSDDEKQMLADSPDFAYLLQEFPAGLHIKPEGQAQIKLGWAFNRTAESPQWQVSTLDQFAEIVLRGASRFIPALAQYLEDKLPATIDYAGYYTRTPENLPLIGELDENLYCIGALAGFGTMCACGAGKLLSETVLQKDLPTYADSLAPSRYENASLMAEINRSAGDGQL